MRILKRAEKTVIVKDLYGVKVYPGNTNFPTLKITEFDNTIT
jgi:hypothetical protein